VTELLGRITFTPCRHGLRVVPQDYCIASQLLPSISEGKLSRLRESSVPFRETELPVVEKDLARFLSAHPDKRMFAKVKAEVACGRVCTGALTEGPSFGEEAQGTNNWVIVAGYFWCFRWEGSARR
jgi:hypothetical protein